MRPRAQPYQQERSEAHYENLLVYDTSVLATTPFSFPVQQSTLPSQKKFYIFLYSHHIHRMKGAQVRFRRHTAFIKHLKADICCVFNLSGDQSFISDKQHIYDDNSDSYLSISSFRHILRPSNLSLSYGILCLSPAIN